MLFYTYFMHFYGQNQFWEIKFKISASIYKLNTFIIQGFEIETMGIQYSFV